MEPADVIRTANKALKMAAQVRRMVAARNAKALAKKQKREQLAAATRERAAVRELLDREMGLTVVDNRPHVDTDGTVLTLGGRTQRPSLPAFQRELIEPEPERPGRLSRAQASELDQAMGIAPATSRHRARVEDDGTRLVLR